MMNTQESTIINALLEKNLKAPANELAQRPKKEIRSKLVTIGYDLAHCLGKLQIQSQDKDNLNLLMQMIEEIHTGSLIVDDIQDNSSVRRGGATVHSLYGMPLALNAGNWLYFKALQNIDQVSLTSQQKLQLYQVVNKALCDAHLGQALDLGSNILTTPAQHVEQVCMNSLEFKSGCLVGLSLNVGAIVASADENLQKKIFNIGKQLGILLQIFDDIGNLNTQTNHPKNLEDLYLKRPSFVWAFLFSHCDESERRTFISAVEKLPDTSILNSLLDESKLKSRMTLKAKQHLNIFKDDLLKHCESKEIPPAVKKILQIGDQLYGAYN